MIKNLPVVILNKQLHDSGHVHKVSHKTRQEIVEVFWTIKPLEADPVLMTWFEQETDNLQDLIISDKRT